LGNASGGSRTFGKKFGCGSELKKDKKGKGICPKGKKVARLGNAGYIIFKRTTEFKVKGGKVSPKWDTKKKKRGLRRLPAGRRRSYDMERKP